MFKVILNELKKIAKDGFIPHESFHTMQDGWKKEIAEVLHELRLKEKVSFHYCTKVDCKFCEKSVGEFFELQKLPPTKTMQI
jgi:hypothetical protein